MSTVTFLVHPERPDALALTLDTTGWLSSLGDSARVLQFTAPDRVSEDAQEMDIDAVDLKGTTVVVSMGGDGTFLRAVRLAWAEDIPVLGGLFRTTNDSTSKSEIILLLTPRVQGPTVARDGVNGLRTHASAPRSTAMRKKSGAGPPASRNA